MDASFLLDFVFDTTKAIAQMLLNGTFRGYPRIRFVFAHMGGVAPYLGERLALGYLNHRFVDPDRTAKPVGVQTGSRARSCVRSRRSASSST